MKRQQPLAAWVVKTLLMRMTRLLKIERMRNRLSKIERLRKMMTKIERRLKMTTETWKVSEEWSCPPA